MGSATALRKIDEINKAANRHAERTMAAMARIGGNGYANPSNQIGCRRPQSASRPARSSVLARSDHPRSSESLFDATELAEAPGCDDRVSTRQRAGHPAGRPERTRYWAQP